MADMRKSLAKLKVVELKEKLQEMGKTPKGLKADLVNQLAEAYEEQNKGMADTTGQHSAPLQAYQTPPLSETMLTSEAPESQYYQQSVGQYSMPGQQVYEQTPNYMQPSYDQQYQYPTHQVFSPPHEQQYNQSTAPYQMTPQLSPRIASQMSPQLSPQMTNPLVPPIQSQITQQLSPQMAPQQYRPAEFQSPHRGFQANETDPYHTEYVGPAPTEQIPHYGIPHMDMHSIPAPQPPAPPIPSQLVHRTPIMESYSPDIPQTQALPQNLAQGMSAFKQENEAFIPTHPSMVPTEAPTDMIDFDDVSIGIDPTNEVPFSQPISVFDQTQPEFEIPDASDQFSRDVNDGQSFSQNNQMQELVTEDTNETTNEESSTDVDSDTNQSFPNEVTAEHTKPIESDLTENKAFSETLGLIEAQTQSQIASEGINQSFTTNESPPELSKFDDNSSDNVQNDITFNKESNQFIVDNEIPNNFVDNESNNESNNEIKMEANQQIDIQQNSSDSKYSDDSQDFDTKIDNRTIASVFKDEESIVEQSQLTKDKLKPLEDSPKPVEEQPIKALSKQIKDQSQAFDDKSDQLEEEPESEKKSLSQSPESQSLESSQVPEEQPLQTIIVVAQEEKPTPKQEPISMLEPVANKQELGTSVEPVVSQSVDLTPNEKTSKVTNVSNDLQNEKPVKQNGFIDTKVKNLTKNQKKKLRKKMRSKRRLDEQKTNETKVDVDNDDRMDIDEEDDEEEIEIEYVPEAIKKDPIYFHYLRVFDKFRTGESDKMLDEEVYVDPVKKMMERKKPVDMELKDDEEKKDGEQKISKRKLKQMTRMTVAELKQRVSHPELVEMHDVTAKDPLLLLHLKATRNSVPVPRHWCYKRKYLQGKRGFEKPPFKLPEFIRRTGIMEMRQALQDKEESKSLKAQMREKIRPKMGKIDIDYQKLHDAFFKWQTKPKMTIHGDLYYEGKEFETRLKEKKPGELSTELRTSLGMPTGPNANKCPPPWLIAMQRYGPPPSYPNIKIPGLNAPIPDGCSFGYHAGGWGKPPVDEYGRPLYGDVFGISSTVDQNIVEEEVDRTLWGEMDSESEEEEESSEEEEETETAAAAGKPAAKEVDESGFVTPAEGLATPSGLTSVPTGMETPDMIELRKRKQIEAEMESGDNPALYTVIPEKKGEKVGREMMGSAHTYDMSAATLRKGQGIDVALDPSDLEAGSLDSASVAARYEQTMKEQSSHLAKEDLSDMVAEHAARQKRKKQQDTSKSSKKYQFKF